MSAVRLGSRKTRWVLAVVGVACAVILTAYIVFLRGGELGDKPIYADLQGLELTQRSSVLTEPTVVLQGETGPILGIPTDDARFPNAWIAATIAKSDGSVYAVMPRSAHLRLPCSQSVVLTEKVNKAARMSLAVSEYLEKNCQH
jgi:hypothetical protein